MNKKVFINEFITVGLENFFAGKKTNLFERHIIECLVDIYGKEEIRNLYYNDNETDFTSLIMSYGLTQSAFDAFIKATNEYEKFKKQKEEKPSLKTDVASKVEICVIKMFLYKCLINEPALEELSHFENDLLNNFEIIKMHFNMSLNPNRTREEWDKKKKILVDNVELVEVKPEYLDEFTYARYGIDIGDVKKMDYKMVTELNGYIKSKLMVITPEEPKPKRKFDFANTVITSGNGFVDALMIMAIIASEMSIGIIYLFLHM